MEFERQLIPDIFLIKPKIFSDMRGYFTETFRKDLLELELGYKINFIQENESKSSRGVLRGLHFQLPPFAQAKLVRVSEGRVLDIAVDIRKSSPSFGQHVALELSAKNKKQLFVPRGFAHGFIVLSDTATFTYKVDNCYAPDHDRGIAFDDKSLAINWQLPFELFKLSAKDRCHPTLSNAKDILG